MCRPSRTTSTFPKRSQRNWNDPVGKMGKPAFPRGGNAELPILQEAFHAPVMKLWQNVLNRFG